jgi:hypothetical protein
MTERRTIPPPRRHWSDEDWKRIKLGQVPMEMENKWFAFVEEGLLHLHRSWTGFEIFEAAFARGWRGWRIKTAAVCDDPDIYKRGRDEKETAFLEQLIDYVLLGPFYRGRYPFYGGWYPQGPTSYSLFGVPVEQPPAD